MTAKSLIIVEDDMSLARALRRLFERRGYVVHHCPDLAAVEHLLAAETPGHAVVDLKLVGPPGSIASRCSAPAIRRCASSC